MDTLTKDSGHAGIMLGYKKTAGDVIKKREFSL